MLRSLALTMEWMQYLRMVLSLFAILYSFCKRGIPMSSYARSMIELRADVELKDTIMVAMPKLIGEGFYMCTIRVEYEWKPPSSISTTLIVERIDKVKRQINDVKFTLVDDDGKPIPKVVSKVNEDSDSEVEDVALSDDFDITVRGQKKK
ncbi:hypothetical protein Tco_1098517 [Tanacetum coccineum]